MECFLLITPFSFYEIFIAMILFCQIKQAVSRWIFIWWNTVLCPQFWMAVL